MGGLVSDAQLLADVYVNLPASAVPLDELAIPPKVVRHGNSPVRSSVLVGIARAVKGTGQDDLDAKCQIYSNAYHSVIPKVREAAANAAASLLNQQVKELAGLDRRFSAPGVAEQLHDIAIGVERKAGGFGASETDRQSAKKALGRDEVKVTAPSSLSQADVYDVEFEAAKARAQRGRVAGVLAASGKAEINQLCRVLSGHPDLIEIMRRYAKSADNGAGYLKDLLTESMAATATLDARLRLDPDHLWRYPPLIAIAIKQLGLDQIEGFTDYIADLQPVLASYWLQDVLFIMGLVIFVVAFIVTFPLSAAAAAGSVGAAAALTGLAVADMAVTVPAAVVSYVEERENDLAVRGSDFNPANRIAQPQGYPRTALGMAAAFLSCLALVRSASRLSRLLRTNRIPAMGARIRLKMQSPRGVGYRERLAERSGGKAHQPDWMLRPQRGGNPPPAKAVGAPVPQPEPLVDAVSKPMERPWLAASKPPRPASVAMAGGGGSTPKPGTAGLGPGMSAGSKLAGPSSKALGGKGTGSPVSNGTGAKAKAAQRPQTGKEAIQSGTEDLEPGKSPLGEYGIDKYSKFANRPYDKLAGHELLQNLWLELKGFGKRLESAASKDNPAIGLSWKEHQRVNDAQRRLGLYDRATVAKQTAMQNINMNAKAMKEAGIPPDVIRVHKAEAIKHAQSLGLIPVPTP